jgi:hypothetical protein
MANYGEDQIEVELDDQKPSEDDIRVIPDHKPAKSLAIDPNDAIQALKKQLDDSEMARRQAESAARAEYERSQRATREVDDTNLTLVTNAIETVRRESEILENNLAEAFSTGDHRQAASIQRQISANEARLLQLETGRDAMKSQPRQAAPPPRMDPVEALASTLSPRSAEWVRRNPDYARDPRKMQEMVAAHQLAIARGAEADTDDYFERVEAVLGVNRQSRDSDDYSDPVSSASSPSKGRVVSPPAAPVSRGSNGVGGNPRPNVVRLTAAERETARDLGMTNEDYARNKVALQREGKLN